MSISKIICFGKQQFFLICAAIQKCLILREGQWTKFISLTLKLINNFEKYDSAKKEDKRDVENSTNVYISHRSWLCIQAKEKHWEMYALPNADHLQSCGAITQSAPTAGRCKNRWITTFVSSGMVTLCLKDLQSALFVICCPAKDFRCASSGHCLWFRTKSFVMAG